MNTYIVYKHTNLINNKIYIGITVHGENPNIRWQNGRGYSENEKFFSDILKYGWNNFSHEILAKNLTEKEALQIESELIKSYNSVKEGYNNSYGNQVHGEQSRQKISKALTGIKRKQSSIQKQLQTKKDNCGYGCGFDPITSKRVKKVRCKETGDVFGSIAEAGNWSGTLHVGDCCLGLREHAGRHPETNQLLSWEYADDADEITIRCEERIKEKKQYKKVRCVETGIIYKTASEASKQTKIAACNIIRVCKGERKTAGKYHWRYE